MKHVVTCTGGDEFAKAANSSSSLGSGLKDIGVIAPQCHEHGLIVVALERVVLVSHRWLWNVSAERPHSPVNGASSLAVAPFVWCNVLLCGRATAWRTSELDDSPSLR